jgi:hypothetical protein
MSNSPDKGLKRAPKLCLKTVLFIKAVCVADGGIYF